jgi:hypothetical protein
LHGAGLRRYLHRWCRQRQPHLGNVVLAVRGNPAASRSASWFPGTGLYLDDNASGVQSSNTVIDADHGVHDASANAVTANHQAGNRVAQLAVRDEPWH